MVLSGMMHCCETGWITNCVRHGAACNRRNEKIIPSSVLINAFEGEKRFMDLETFNAQQREDARDLNTHGQDEYISRYTQMLVTPFYPMVHNPHNQGSSEIVSFEDLSRLDPSVTLDERDRLLLQRTRLIAPHIPIREVSGKWKHVPNESTFQLEEYNYTLGFEREWSTSLRKDEKDLYYEKQRLFNEYLAPLLYYEKEDGRSYAIYASENNKFTKDLVKILKQESIAALANGQMPILLS